MVEIEKLRNIGIIAHIDAGKTTTTERILYYTGQEHKMGDVDDGTTTADYLPLERDKGITIVSAAVTCCWKDHPITIIDTPGHIDFTAEVERSLRVLDGAVGIFCAVGAVEAQSETVWRQADRYKIPRIAFVNKMDRAGADFDNVVDALTTRLKACPAVISIPWGKESDFQGVIDLIAMKALSFDSGSKGKEVVEQDIPKELLPEAETYREQLIDTLADVDDEIIEKYSEGVLTKKDILQSLRKATLQNKLTPVLVGSSLKHKGVQCLLDAIVNFLPAPSDRPPVVGINPKTGRSVSRKISDKDICALAFKSVYAKHGDISYLRLYSGTIREGMQLYNPAKDKVERVNRLCRIYANHLLKCDSAGPGDIVGVVGLRYTVTGDTLCKKKRPIVLEQMKFPETVISKTIEPRTLADKDHMMHALEVISRDDPTFEYSIDEDTGQTLICGMGELHLDIIHSRIQSEHHLDVNLGRPRVSYRETIGKVAQSEFTYEKTFAGKDHFAMLKVRVKPCPDSLEVKNLLSPEQVPRQFFPAIEDGACSAISSGELAGYPLINIEATILDGKAHATNSTDLAFSKAAYEATRDAMQKAGYALMEPLMRMQIQTPINYLGDVIHNLNSRRAVIEEMTLLGDVQVVTGKVPLAEMFGYSNDLRTLSQGRATFTMEPLKYEIVPEEIQKKIIDIWD